MWDVFHFVSLNLISSALSFHLSWILVKEPRITLEALDLSIIVMCILCMELFCQRKPLFIFDSHDKSTQKAMTHLKRRSFWTSRRRSHGNDCQLHGTYNTKRPLAEYHALLGQRFQTHFAQDIDPHDASGVALLGSRFATQKEMKWHCKLHSSSDKNADTSCSQSGNQCTQKQAHNKFTWRFFIIWWHVLCSKTASRFTLSREGLVHNPTLHCETSHGWKFFWTWRLGKKGKCAGRGLHMSSLSW